MKAFVIDSLRHPDEAMVLKEVYGNSFFLLGVVSEPKSRRERLYKKFYEKLDVSNVQKKEIDDLLKRDQHAEENYGQRVADTFHLADYFIDNSLDEETGNGGRLVGLNNSLERFVKLILRKEIEPPTILETAMHQANSSKMRSSCLSKQVGATIVSASGNIIATGTNDVPKSGGGLYGENIKEHNDYTITYDCRCFKYNGYFSNNREQNEIIDELLKTFPELTESRQRDEVVQQIRSLRIGSLIEFSKAVHAELHAILSVAESGESCRGCTMCVTTFPCHYCARHIVAAGIKEVHFIEPYPKSKAIELHEDSITLDKNEMDSESKNKKVLFCQFVGVSPNLYPRMFLKDREFKNKITGIMNISDPKWGSQSKIYELSYLEIEEKLRWET